MAGVLQFHWLSPLLNGWVIAGTFPPSRLGNQWVVLAIDHLTNYVIAVVLPSGPSAEIANYFCITLSLNMKLHGCY